MVIKAQGKYPSSFSLPARVYWEDTDAGGVVYHARYLAFMERARTEWMRRLGYGQEQLRAKEGIVFVVCQLSIDFLKPAHLDDLLTVTVNLETCHRVSLRFAQRIERGTDTLIAAQVRLAAIDAVQMRPKGMGHELHRHLSEWRQIESNHERKNG